MVRVDDRSPTIMRVTTEKLLGTLTLLDNFVRPKNATALGASLLPDDEYLLGAYINNPDNFILITDLGLHWMRFDTISFVSFDSIQEVVLPEDARAACLVLKLESGEEVYLDIVNYTEDTPDLFAWHEFLMSVIFFPHKSSDVRSIAEIRSLRDLESFLNQHSSEGEELFELVYALRQGFPKPWQLRQLDIDPSLLARPDVCRLLALFLSRDFDRFVHDAKSENVASYAAAQFERVGESPDTLQFKTRPAVAGSLSAHISKSLSPGAEEILKAAAVEAQRDRRRTIGLRDLLGAIAGYDSRLTCERLQRKGVSKEAVREAAARVDQSAQSAETQREDVETAQTVPPASPVAIYAPSVLWLLDDALDERDQGGVKKILPEHILTAFTKVTDRDFLRLLQQFERNE